MRRADDHLEKLQLLSKQQESSEVGEQEDGRKNLAGLWQGIKSGCSLLLPFVVTLHFQLLVVY